MPALRQTRLLAGTIALAVAAGGVFSCSSGTQIATPGGGFGDSTASRKKSPTDDDVSDAPTEEELFDEDGQLREAGSLGQLADGKPREILYPDLDLRGAGSLSCKGERYDTIAKYRVKMSIESLNLDFYEGRVVNAGSSVEDRANPKIAQKLGVTTYERPTKSERDEWVKSGFKWAPYAIFADKVVKQNGGATFKFSEPLPVFPWPAKQSFFDALAAAPQTWTSSVTGGPDGNFTAKVTVTLVGTSGDETTLKLSLLIPEDTDRHIYESFPLPKEATYAINAKTLDVRRVTATNWYRGDDACDHRPEDITLDYNLCVKTVPGKEPQTYPCPI